MFFTGVHWDSVSFEWGLYGSDGTTAGTILLMPGMEVTSPDFAVLDNILYFTSSNNPVSYNSSLCRTDGTPQGTYVVKDELTFPTWMAAYNNYKQCYLTTFKDKLYFSAYPSGTSDNHLWQSDGTTAGTVVFKDFSPAGSPAQLTVGKDRLYFKLRDEERVELWSTDGTDIGTARIENAAANNIITSNLTARLDLRKPMCAFNNQILLNNTYDTAIGAELYRYRFGPVSVSEVAASTEDILFPNPAHDYVELKEAAEITIYDLSGRMIIRDSGKRANVSRLVPGVYMARISRNGLSSFAKFLKE
jgi:ELWxxDGT repeat protein